MRRFGSNRLLILGLSALLLSDLKGRKKAKGRLADSRLDIATSSMVSGRLLRVTSGLEIFVLLLDNLILAPLLLLADIPDSIESSLGISSVHRG